MFFFDITLTYIIFYEVRIPPFNNNNVILDLGEKLRVNEFCFPNMYRSWL